jgi:cytochrome c oxidase cbb3-type subunit 3
MDILHDEEKLLLEHESDGIRELDNLLPAWWKYLFYVTIVFAIVYFSGYELFAWFLNQDEEYRHELALFAKKYPVIEQKTPAIEELLQDRNILSSGKKTFGEICYSCHGTAGEGNIGPNLTDAYWLNIDGSFQSILAAIAKGIQAKGMPAWKSLLGDKKIQQVAAYIVTLQGSNPPNAKKAEGNLYKFTLEQEKEKEAEKK